MIVSSKCLSVYLSIWYTHHYGIGYALHESLSCYGDISLASGEAYDVSDRGIRA